jgi:hypothetical protein
VASALDLSEPITRPDRLPYDIPEEGVGLSDYLRATAAGAYGVAGSVGGFTEYATGGELGKGLRQFGQAGAREQTEQMSTGAQRALSANVIPGQGDDIFDRDISTRHAIGLRVASAVPSLIASMVPGAVVARVALAAGASTAVAGEVGTLAGGAAGGVMSGGDVFNQIIEEIGKTPDKDLQRDSPTYAGLRNMGMDENEAKEFVGRRATAYKPLIMGAITALTSRYGVEHAVAHRSAGAAGRGVLRGGALGAVGEASQEAIEGFSGELLAQQGVFDAKAGDGNYEWTKALEQAVSGALVGGITGGVVGAGTSRQRPAGSKPQSDQRPDTTAEAPLDVAGELAGDRVRATDATMDLERVRNPGAVAGHEMAAVVGQKPAEALGGVAAEPATRTTGITPAPMSVGLDHAAAMASSEVTSGVTEGTPPPIPTPIVVTSPEVTAAITRTIQGQVSQATAPPPAAPNPAEALAATAAPNVTASTVEPLTAGVTPGVTPTLTQPGIGQVSQPGVANPVVGRPSDATAVSSVSGTQTPLTASTPIEGTPGLPGNGLPEGKVAGVPAADPIPSPAGKPRRDYTLPKDTASKREQRARGETEILPKKEDDARQLRRAYDGVIERVRSFLAANPYDPARMESPEAIRSYMAKMVKDADLPPNIKLARLKLEADPALAHLAQALALHTPGKGSKSKLRDFMVNDRDLRTGGDLARTSRQAESRASAEVSLTGTEDIIPSTAPEYDVAQQTTIDDELATRADEEEAGVTAIRPLEEGAVSTQQAAVREQVEKAPEKFVTPGVNKAGTFKAETKRRKIEVPAKKPTVRIQSAADMKNVRKQVETKPTDAQKEAGNYGKGHMRLHGQDIAIENSKGSTRSGVNKKGVKWVKIMKYDYGYINRTVGADNDQIDVVIGPNPKARVAYVINQVDKETGKFDEHKLFMGFDKTSEVRQAYDDMFENDSTGRADLTVYPYIAGKPLNEWLAKAKMKPATVVTEATPQPTPQTEADAAEQVADQRIAENADVIGGRTDEEIRLLGEVGAHLESEMRAAGLWDEAAETAKAKAGVTSEVTKDEFRSREANDEPLPGTRGVTTNKGEVIVMPSVRWRDIASSYANRISKKRGPAANLLPAMMDILEPYIGGTRVYFATPEQMLKLRGKGKLAPRGLYNWDKGFIVLNTDFRNDVGDFTHTIVHEGVHAALNDLIETNPAVAQVITTMALEVRAALKPVLRLMSKDVTYGLQVDKHGNPDPHEFMAEIMSNAELQHIAAALPASEELREAVGLKNTGSLWDAFVATARKWFGVPPGQVSILEVALRHAENILASEGRSKMAKANEKIGEGPYKLLGAKDIADEAHHTAKGFLWGLHKKLIWASSVDQLVRSHRDKFSKGLADRYYDTMATMFTQAENGAVEGMEIAKKAEEFRRANPEEWQRAEVVIARANEDDVDPRKPMDQDRRMKGNKNRHRQRKERFKETQALYKALRPDTKAFIDSIQGFYRKTQHKRVRNLASASLNAFNELNPNKLTQAQIDDLVERTVTGNLTPKPAINPVGKSDEELINDAGTWDALTNASEMREARGMYFPFMRHGNHVVRAVQKLPPLMGGEIVSQDDKRAVIQFKGKDLKEAKAKYVAWSVAKSTADGPTVSSVRIRRTMDGEVVSAAMAKGQPHEIAYEVGLDIQHMQTFDTDRQAREFIADAKGEFQRIDAEPLTRNEASYDASMNSPQIARLLGQIDKRTDISENQRTLMKQTVSQSAIMLQPGNRIQQRQLKRQGTRGAAYDSIRGLQAYAEAGAQADARAEHMPNLTELLKDLRKETGKVGDANAAIKTQVVQEFEKRLLGSIVNPSMPGRFTQNLLRLSNIDKLASPAYNLINGLQTWMVAGPYLGGNYGNIRTMAALGRAYNDIGFGNVLWQGMRRTGQAFRSKLDTSNIQGSIRAQLAKQEDGVRLVQLFDHAVKIGVSNDGSAMELAQAVKGGKRGWGSIGLEKVDSIARQMTLAVEAVNRNTVLVAAYRLEYSQSQNHELAQQAAIDAANATQFNYAGWNQPQFFNHPLGRIAFQFKKYAQGMTALMADMVYRAFKGASPQEKRKAWKQIANLFAVQIMMAGALGLPGVELVKALSMIAAVLGVGSWGDTERYLRKLAEDALGEKWGGALMRGVLTRAIGLDLSSRVGLSDLWLYGEPKSSDRQDVMAYFGQFVAGAPGGLMFDWYDAGKDAGKGDFWKAFEKIVPIKMVSDISAAIRGRTDPTVREPMTSIEAGMKAVGLRSARLADAGEKTGRDIAVQKKFEERKKELQSAYLSASTSAERMKIKGKITAHNKEFTEKQKEHKLGFRLRVSSPATMDKWIKEREAKRAKVLGE